MTEQMIEYNESIIRKIIFHTISIDKNKSKLSEKAYDYKNEEEEELLKKIFLKPFVSVTATYTFKHHVDIALNPLYKISKELYEGGNFEKLSKDVFQHLQSVSKHPNIKDGELFIIQLEDVKLNNKYYEAIGIYKIENKENFVRTSSESGHRGLFFQKGINKKADKGCLIIFTEGLYTLLLIDNDSLETDYWLNEFINVNLKKDNINNTSQFLTIAKSFVTNQLPNEYEITKANQIEYLNRSVDYFKTHEKFDKGDFEQSVFEDNQLITSFRKFDKSYRKVNEIDFSDKFEISPQAVKKQSRTFKNIIKLDRNFDIFVHGNTGLIEQGIEKDGRKFYKIYYEEEN